MACGLHDGLWKAGLIAATDCRARKEKGPRSLRTEGLAAWRTVDSMHEAWPKAHHRAPPDLAVQQHPLCSGARPSLQPKSLARRDRNRFRSLQGRVTTATPIPRYWTSCMAGWPVDMKAVWARCSRTSG